jgi:hypothetical protein
VKYSSSIALDADIHKTVSPFDTADCIISADERSYRIFVKEEMYSSESSIKIQSLFALEIEKFRAAEKSSIHAKSKTSQPNFTAMSRAPSVKPVSTTTILSKYFRALSRLHLSLPSSFLMIMQSVMSFNGCLVF